MDGLWQLQERLRVWNKVHEEGTSGETIDLSLLLGHCFFHLVLDYK